ncbi:hypothetical protein HZU75_04485 [Chitinibacter fontanus]|uniref:Uncharacterized protein n=1 Tax=Chitinibacter fontanus TaxID=1737446 RepID=A0A7D5Z9J2_9NEIS|nr:hypothetical protein [Chitinibacter fontanus]QLI80845.1 hypothetical protein HZU75_04485 [Chitinibacter fontanus]
MPKFFTAEFIDKIPAEYQELESWPPFFGALLACGLKPPPPPMDTNDIEMVRFAYGALSNERLREAEYIASLWQQQNKPTNPKPTEFLSWLMSQKIDKDWLSDIDKRYAEPRVDFLRNPLPDWCIELQQTSMKSVTDKQEQTENTSTVHTSPNTPFTTNANTTLASLKTFSELTDQDKKAIRDALGKLMKKSDCITEYLLDAIVEADSINKKKVWIHLQKKINAAPSAHPPFTEDSTMALLRFIDSPGTKKSLSEKNVGERLTRLTARIQQQDNELLLRFL